VQVYSVHVHTKIYILDCITSSVTSSVHGTARYKIANNKMA